MLPAPVSAAGVWLALVEMSRVSTWDAGTEAPKRHIFAIVAWPAFEAVGGRTSPAVSHLKGLGLRRRDASTTDSLLSEPCPKCLPPELRRYAGTV